MKVQMLSFLAVLVLLGISTGCDTINDIDKIKLPLTFTGRPKVDNDTANTIRFDGVNLDTVNGYVDNRDKIDENGSEIQSMSVSIVKFISNEVNLQNCVFENVEFWLQYDPIYGDNTVYPLGTYTDVKASDYYLTPRTLTLDKGKLQEAIKYVKTRPRFRVYQRYGKVKNFPNRQPEFVNLTTKVSVTILLKPN